MLIKFSVK